MCSSETFEMTPTVLTACSPAGHEHVQGHATAGGPRQSHGHSAPSARMCCAAKTARASR